MSKKAIEIKYLYETVIIDCDKINEVRLLLSDGEFSDYHHIELIISTQFDPIEISFKEEDKAIEQYEIIKEFIGVTDILTMKL